MRLILSNLFPAGYRSSIESDDEDELEDIKGGRTAIIDLFPAAGTERIHQEGRRKTKVSARWEICLKLLGGPPKYQEAIAAAANVPRERSPWANRIKNRLRTMGKETRAYIEIMGQTGARIECAADIDTTKENSFTTKWRTYSPYNSRTVLSPFTEEIEHECPWFFEMRELMGSVLTLYPSASDIAALDSTRT
ncbi:hypothetical protein B0H14DRAFT_3646957 [Mycena olivaceomarginata]|nr:hypothetical protein B0H14DRAFT_3646957 [Mycena olivaceomarginata]